MEWLWHALVIAVVVIPVTIMWIAIIVELFTRRDLKWWQRLGWLLFILIFPLIGALIYILYTWSTAGRREQGLAPTSPRVAGGSSNAADSATDLSSLDRLRRQGVITEAQFEAGKRRVLEGITPEEEATATQPINTQQMPKHGASS